MKKFRKLLNNLLSKRAVSVLGPSLYSAYLLKFLANFPKIMRVGSLSPLDKSMGKIANRFHYRGQSFFFDCHFCDEHLNEDSFGFGIAREIYIRDCYFKWHPSSTYESAKTVIDLGANRGAFSALMTTQAKFILSVECGEQYAPTIKHNFNSNGFDNYAIETAFIGAFIGGCEQVNYNLPALSIDELLKLHDIESVDLIKMDIEGSEFALFDSEGSKDWLQRVGAISMEVHPLHGNPNTILKVLNQQGFTYIIADENLQRVNDSKLSIFIYAWRKA